MNESKTLTSIYHANLNVNLMVKTRIRITVNDGQCKNLKIHLLCNEVYIWNPANVIVKYSESNGKYAESVVDYPVIRVMKLWKQQKLFQQKFFPQTLFQKKIIQKIFVFY